MPGSITGARAEALQRFVVTAQQMGDIESRQFAAGMPVAALMEKVAGRITQRVTALYPQPTSQFGILVGPGHNGGDALVVARELHFRGYPVTVFCPFESLKELTDCHARYLRSLGVPFSDRLDSLSSSQVLLDGLFGFGLTRNLEGAIAQTIDTLNRWDLPVLSIDLPSGIHTDTGAVMGTALRAAHTFCLGLWKRAFLQDPALEFIGNAELVDFDLPLTDLEAILGTPQLSKPLLTESALQEPTVQRITPAMARASLPLPRVVTSHKYQAGHALLVAGSRQYMGAALLSGLAARASGVGMLSIAVPASMQSLVVGQIPDALVIGCAELPDGAIAHLPPDLDLGRFDAIACGPGITPGASALVEQVLAAPVPLVLDADGLNILAQWGTQKKLRSRPAPTVLTPHPGEFRRLFPALTNSMSDRITVTLAAARESGAIVLLKGARVAIATPEGKIWLNPESTPALARGGSGDVLTGLLIGLLSQNQRQNIRLEASVQAATWHHAQAGRLAAAERTELGVDASTLVQYLIKGLSLSVQ